MIYNTINHAAVAVTFAPGTTDPLIATDPTSGLDMAFNVTSVARKVGEPVGVYTVVLSSPIAEVTMVPNPIVICETDSLDASVHPTVDADGMVTELEVQGYHTQGASMGDLADIKFVLRIDNQWMSA